MRVIIGGIFMTENRAYQLHYWIMSLSLCTVQLISHSGVDKRLFLNFANFK